MITPSFPTSCIALAIKFPITSSLFALIEATFAICASSTGWLFFLISSTTISHAFCIPRFNDIGLAPAVTFLIPSVTRACAKTVAVVVPSPATSFVFVETSFTN